MASSFWCRDSYDGTYIGLPQAARQVPRSTLLHIVYFKRISYPLTSRPSELWIIEVDQAGNESWRTAEDFIYRFCPPTEDTTIQYWANSWREYNDIPPLSSTQTSQSQFPVLPQPQHSRATAGRPDAAGDVSFLRAKRPQRRTARTNGCFRRLLKFMTVLP